MHIPRGLTAGYGLLLALVFLPLSSLAAQSVDTVSPASGTVGATLTITGAGFGAFKPVVWLASDEQPGKKRKLQIITASDGKIVGRIVAKQLPEGPYVVFVDPMGPAAPFSGDAIYHAVPPEIDDFQPKRVTPGGRVVIRGRHFGDRKGRVYHGDRRVKVTTWRDDLVSVRVPKSGSGVLRVVSRTGVGLAFCSLASSDDDLPPPTPPFLNVFGDIQDGANTSALLRCSLKDRGGTLSLVGFTGASPARLIEIVLQVEPGVDQPYPTSLIAIDHVRLSTLDGSLVNGEWVAVRPPITTSSLTGQPGSCSLIGKLDVVLVRTGGTGPDELELTLHFRLDVGLIEMT